MRPVLFLLLFLVLAIPRKVSAQSPSIVESLIQTNDELNETLREKRETIQYLQKALGIDERTSATDKNISVRIIDAYGSESENTIYVKGVITYTGTDRLKLKFGANELVDLAGVSYESSEVLQPPGMEGFSVYNPGIFVPYTFVVKFKGIKERMPVLRSIRLSLIDVDSEPTVLNLAGIDVFWPETSRGKVLLRIGGLEFRMK